VRGYAKGKKAVWLVFSPFLIVSFVSSCLSRWPKKFQDNVLTKPELALFFRFKRNGEAFLFVLFDDFEQSLSVSIDFHLECLKRIVKCLKKKILKQLPSSPIFKARVGCCFEKAPRRAVGLTTGKRCENEPFTAQIEIL